MKLINVKTIKTAVFIGLITVCVKSGFAPTLAQAGAGASGGGSFIYLDNAPEMADPFVKIDNSIPGDEYKLTEPMRQYLEGIKELVKRYGISDRDINWNEGLKFWENEVLGKNVTYRVVETPKDLPCQDVMEIDPTKLPNNSSAPVTQFGCTYDHITYFARSELENKPLRLQALAILHERLHSFSGDQGHARISPFISTLDRMITMKRAQNQGSPYKPLSPSEIAQWENSISKLAQGMGFVWYMGTLGPQPQKTVTKDGGVCFGQCTIDSESTVGVGSIIGENSVVRSSKILNSKILDSKIENTEVVNSTLYYVQASGAQIALSYLAGQPGYTYRFPGDGRIVVAPQVSILGLNLLLEISGSKTSDYRLVLNPKSGKLTFDGTKTCSLRYREFFGSYMFSNEVELTEDSQQFYSNCQ